MQNRKCFRRAAITTLLLTASLQASAAGWEGYYFGGQYGKANTRTDWTYTNRNYFNTLDEVLVGNNFNVSTMGNIGGIYLGYNYQISMFIMGVEGALQKASLNKTSASPFFPATDTESTNVRRFGTVKARVGYAYQSWLLSLSGGWATANVNLSVQDTSNNIMASSSQWVNGWITGTAVEYKITESISLGLAYDYMKLSLSNKSLSCSACGTGVGNGTPIVNNTFKIKTVTTRLSYYFN